MAAITINVTTEEIKKMQEAITSLQGTFTSFGNVFKSIFSEATTTTTSFWAKFDAEQIKAYDKIGTWGDRVTQLYGSISDKMRSSMKSSISDAFTKPYKVKAIGKDGKPILDKDGKETEITIQPSFSFKDFKRGLKLGFRQLSRELVLMGKDLAIDEAYNRLVLAPVNWVAEQFGGGKKKQEEDKKKKLAAGTSGGGNPSEGTPPANPQVKTPPAEDSALTAHKNSQADMTAAAEEGKSDRKKIYEQETKDSDTEAKKRVASFTKSQDDMTEAAQKGIDDRKNLGVKKSGAEDSNGAGKRGQVSLCVVDKIFLLGAGKRGQVSLCVVDKIFLLCFATQHGQKTQN